jgi:hypothetical protein
MRTNRTLEGLMADFPRSLLEFQRRFPDPAACAAWLSAARWPDGFVCPACAGVRGWALATKAWTFECAACRRQTSVTAGTVLHGSKLPLTVWFWAAYLMATHSNGISALQLQKQLGLGSYKTAWLLCAKLRRAMVAPGRAPLAGLVEVDETAIPCRAQDDPPGGGGRSGQGKLLIAGAAEVQDGRPGRIRLAALEDFSANRLHAFLAASLAPGATAKTDGWSGYPGAPGLRHEPHVIGACPGCTACLPTSRPGLWASTTACVARTSRPTSTSSPSASTAAAPATPRSEPCSASASPSNPQPTTC